MNYIISKFTRINEITLILKRLVVLIYGRLVGSKKRNVGVTMSCMVVSRFVQAGFTIN